MAYIPFNQYGYGSVGAGIGSFIDPLGLGKLFGGGKKKSKQPAFQFQPYGGARPPSPEFLRPAEALTWNTISKRSQGQDVGFDPARREALTALVKSELGKREEDELRSARGAISSSGLSGNPRAAEALSGRVSRDIGRTLGDELAKISIEDLTAANEEKRENTGYLQDFNKFNFGQSNRVADFDLDVYSAEEGNRARSFGLNEGVRQYGQNREDDQLAGLFELLGTGIGAYAGGPAGAAIGSQVGGSLGTNTLRGSGTGIAPTAANALATPSFYGQGLRYPRRNITR